MYFAIASAIIAVACSAITIKTLVGYSDIRRSRKIIVGFLVVVGWFAPLFIGLNFLVSFLLLFLFAGGIAVWCQGA